MSCGNLIDDIMHASYWGGVWDCSALRFSSSTPCFLAKRFQLHALGSRKKGGVVKAPKEVLYKLQFFMELLYSVVCGAVSNTPWVCIYVLWTYTLYCIILKKYYHNTNTTKWIAHPLHILLLRLTLLSLIF